MNLLGTSMGIHHIDESRLLNNAYDSGIPFKDFVLRKRFNRTLLVLTLLVLVFSFIVFKSIYPYAGFINADSYQYITSAYYNLRVDFYPIGYPKFIRLLSVFSYNDTILVACQYFLFEFALISFLYSIFYFFNLAKWVRVVLLALIAPNPVFLLIANYVSSDCLFLALSIFWFTNLIWLIHRPSFTLIIVHSLLILLALMVRYNALFYPLVSLIAFAVNKRAFVLKFVGIGLTLLLLSIFINYTSNQFKRITGEKQFTPFSGWQLANNALYAYRFIDSSNRVQLPVRFRNLDQDVRNYFDSTRDLKKNPQEMLIASTVYMWDSTSPLRIFMNKQFLHDSTKGELSRWAKVAPLYKDYGSTLIKTYPNTFLKYYLWPNFLKYYVPPIEFLEYYSTNVDTVPPVAKQWFWYKGNHLIHRTEGMKISILDYHPIFSGAINAVFLVISILFLWLVGINLSDKLFQIGVLFVSFWLMNMGFSVFASPIALRFQLFPIVISTTYCFFMTNKIIDRLLTVDERSEPSKNKSIKSPFKDEYV